MNKEYRTISDEIVSFSKTIERSRFIGYAKKVTTAEEALTFIAQLKQQCYDSTHVCYAFVTDESVRYSDDGEPQGTAGMPILDVITKQKLCKLCVAVVRYYGGIKLGAGGLTRAYGGTAVDTLNQAQRVLVKYCNQYSIILPYALVKAAQKLCERYGKVDNIEYGEFIKINVTVTATKDDFIERVVDETNGKITPIFEKVAEVESIEN
ncbi:MAG: YigZ family protein [Clostridia bacterium]